jgi:hypothetical protein
MNNNTGHDDATERRLTCLGKRIKTDDNEELAVTVENIHAVFESTGRSVVNLIKGGERYDKGRLIAFLDALDQAKNIAIQAIHLAQQE